MDLELELDKNVKGDEFALNKPNLVGDSNGELATLAKKIMVVKDGINGNSLNTYLANVRKLYMALFGVEFDDINRLRKFKKVQAYLESFPIYTRKNILVSLIVALRGSGMNKRVLNKYVKYFHELVAQINDNYKKHALSEKDKKNWVTHEDIERIRNELEEKIAGLNFNKMIRKEKDYIQQHLVLMLYTKLPPLRNNYVDMVVITKSPKGLPKSKEHNYIVLDRKKIVLNKYKTVKTYGQKISDVPDYIIGLVKRWMKYNPTRYLLINTTTNTPMGTNGLTKYLNKIFKPKKVSTTMLRKFYLSHKYPVNFELERQKKKDANIMGHSVKTQQRIYRKALGEV